jgi:hypothetical protein
LQGFVNFLHFFVVFCGIMSNNVVSGRMTPAEEARMSSPFPGMDPSLEGEMWQEFDESVHDIKKSGPFGPDFFISWMLRKP